jgi:DNA-binding transcriptional regulator LsrR (DeoR family)
MKPKKVTVLRLKDILRLHYEAHLSIHQIALSMKISRGAISKYLVRARLAVIAGHE